ncbi:MAG: tyrosine-type recombinase/integrase, partial [Rhizobiales bacterium]|nr:tyrosine-type recombinase/integrase [Hyphomicrobiales bacterium]
MPAEKTAVRHAFELRIPSNAELVEMIQPNTSMRAVMARTTAFAGLRLGELCRLDWEDVDLEDRVIRVMGGPLRVIPLPPLLAGALREWNGTVSANRMNLVFPRRSGDVFSCRGLAAWFKGGGGLYARYPHLSLHRFFMIWCSAGLSDGRGGLTANQLAYLLGHRIPLNEEFVMYSSGYTPIDM